VEKYFSKLAAMFHDSSMQYGKFNCWGKRPFRLLADAGYVSDEAHTKAVMLTDKIMRLLYIISPN